MKAVVATRQGGPEVLELKDEPDPNADSGKVLIRVLRAGVNFADLHSTQGRYANSPPPPFIPGLEVSGHEVESGRPVLALVPTGGYAELVAADPRLTFDASGVDLERAGGALLVTLTAFYALTEIARLRPTDHVLVHAAAGGLGSTVVQMAKALGAAKVIGVASTPEKREFALEQGADEAIGYEEERPPIDVVVDGVGGDAAERSLESVRQLGRMVLLGLSSGDEPRIPGFAEMRRRNVGALGFSFGAFRAADPERVVATAGPAIELLRQGKIKPTVWRTLPLAQAAEAHRLLGGRTSMGKILLAP
jgi:NADPH2:quinone reductase